MRAHDQPRADVRRAAGERLFDLLFAERLEGAVVGLDVLRAGLGELLDGTLLGHGHRVRRVHRDAGDEDVVADRAGEELRRVAHEPREVPGRVHDGFPFATPERVEPAVTITGDPLDVRVEVRVRRPAVEEGHLVTRVDRRVDHGATEELGTAEQEESHVSSAMAARSRSTSSAVLVWTMPTRTAPSSSSTPIRRIVSSA